VRLERLARSHPPREHTGRRAYVNRLKRRPQTLSGPASFYLSDAGAFASTELTRGPWDGASQHAGPPAALLTRGIENCPGIGADRAARTIGRVTFEILRPVPIAPLLVAAEVIRPGRRVDLVSATLRERDSGEELIRARGWRLLRSEVALPSGLTSTEPGSAAALAGRPTGSVGPLPGPQGLTAAGDAFFPTGFEVGYHTGMEYRFAEGGFMEPGPTVCWMRMRRPLIEGEEPTPLQRVLIAADSGNGISSALEFRTHVFINLDLSVHLHRMPEGQWVGLDSLTIPEPNGVGMSDTMLWDELGPLGRACQTLLIAER